MLISTQRKHCFTYLAAVSFTLYQAPDTPNQIGEMDANRTKPVRMC